MFLFTVASFHLTVRNVSPTSDYCCLSRANTSASLSACSLPAHAPLTVPVLSAKINVGVPLTPIESRDDCLISSTVTPSLFKYCCDLLAITNTTWERKKATGTASSGLWLISPHTGQSSQLSFDHNQRNAQFLPAVTRSALNLPLTSESLRLKCGNRCEPTVDTLRNLLFMPTAEVR